MRTRVLLRNRHSPSVLCTLERVARGLLLVCPLALMAWMFFDGRFPTRLVNVIVNGYWMPVGENGLSTEGDLGSLRDLRSFGFLVIGTIYFVCLATFSTVFCIGSVRIRSIASLGTLAASIALVMVTLMESEEIVMTGRVWRGRNVSQQLSGFLRVVDSQWTDDASRSAEPEWTAGLYSHAYPIERPRMRMLASPIGVPGTAFSAIAFERTEGSAIRMELAGPEEGFWIERRLDDGTPSEFIGGLDERFQPRRWARLAPHLFLVEFDRVNLSR